MKTFIKISLIQFLLTIMFTGSLFAQTNNSILKTNDLTDSLMVYYTFSGDTIDESGNGNDATLNGPLFTNDRFDNPNSALSFDGIDDYVDIGNNIKPNLPATVSGWVYLDSLNYTVLLRNDRTDGNSYYNGLQVETADGRLTGWIGCGYAAPSTRRHKSTNDTVFTQKTWHHFAVVYADYDTINLYVDGKEYDGDWGNGTGTEIRYSDSYNGALGMRNTGGENKYFLKGSLDDIRVYNRSLSENEVNELYHENGWKSDETVTDIDGNIYRTVKIGDQIWMAENLKVTRYRNGEDIPHITDNSEWAGLSSGAYCAYDNNDSNIDTYGFLYNWYAVDDSRKIAPAGWHVPTDEEWKQLELTIGMSQEDVDTTGWRGDAGNKLKTVSGWDNNGNGTNESGFSAVPAGKRHFIDGTFWNIGCYAEFWASDGDGSDAWFRFLGCNGASICRGEYPKKDGFSIRCVKDINSELVAYYPFNGNANDESGNGYNGTNNGAVLTIDRFDNENSAYYFDGGNDWIEAGLNVKEPTGTISIWFKAEELENSMLFCQIHHPNTPATLNYKLSNNGNDEGFLDIRSDANINAGISTKEITTLNEWHHLVCIWGENGSRLYLDGELQGSTDLTYYDNSSTIKMGIGCYNGHYPRAHYFHGSIDDMRIYNYPLSENEIDSLYTEGGWPLTDIVLDQYQTGIDYGFWLDDEVNRWQEFRPTLNTLTKVQVHLAKYGNPDSLVISITDSTGSVLSANKYADTEISGGWHSVVFKEGIKLNTSSKYRIDIRGTQDSSSPDNRYFWSGSTSSTYDSTCINSVSSSWPDFDFAFRTYGYNDSTTSIQEQNKSTLSNFRLFQNYPNPFNPNTTIQFGLPSNTDVQIDVYNAIGQKVKTIVNQKMPAGSHSVNFDGSALSSGLYFYKISAGKFQQVKKMLLIK